jgi:DGQHR domain-containing protein
MVEEEQEIVVPLDDEARADEAKIGTRIGFGARLVTQGKHRFFTATVPSDVLRDTCSVDMRAEDPIKGFQRRLDPKRAKDIAAYIDSGLGTIPSSIILSAQPEARLKYTSRSQVMSFKRVPRAFLILDGQHRVNGFYLAKAKLRVPVVVYNGLSKADEARLFMDINTTQRPVPNELLLDIKRLANTETDDESLLRDIYDLFNSEPDSPLYGLMSPSEKLSGKLSRVTFNAALKAIFGSFGTNDVAFVYAALSAYLHAWLIGMRARNAPDSITNPTIFRAIMLLFPSVAARVSDRHEDKYTVENFNEILQPLFEKIRKADLVNPVGSHLDVHEQLRRRMESSFAIGRRRLV